MRKVIKQYQNNGKALEVRLEQESAEKFYVILAGMQMRQFGCAGGRCEPGGIDDYQFNDAQTYMVNSFPTYSIAEQAYETIKGKYIDYSWLEKREPVEVYAK